MTTFNEPLARASTLTPESPSPAPEAPRKIPIELRQSKVLLKCGAQTLRIDLCLQNHTHHYAISVYPGFEGGGRDEDHSLAVRSLAPEYTPKRYNADTGKWVEAWPPLPAIERKVDSTLYDQPSLPVGQLPQRLELAMARVEPLLRQLVNQRQLHMGQGRVGQVADKPLIARIKTILTDF